MDDLSPQFAMILLATAVFAVGVGWLLCGRQNKRRLDELGDEWQIKLDNVVRRRDRLIVEIDNLRSSIEAQHAIMRKQENAAHKKDIELHSADEKAKTLE